ncbi:hypothetical protein NDI49_21010 [Trichocoleus sp. ST-U3]
MASANKEPALPLLGLLSVTSSYFWMFRVPVCRFELPPVPLPPVSAAIPDSFPVRAADRKDLS